MASICRVRVCEASNNKFACQLLPISTPLVFAGITTGRREIGKEYEDFALEGHCHSLKAYPEVRPAKRAPLLALYFNGK